MEKVAMEKMHVVAEILVHYDPSEQEEPYWARIRTQKQARKILLHGCRTHAQGRSGPEAIANLAESWKRCGFMNPWR
jgi:hypothetical protein